MSWMPPGPAWLFCPADRPDRYAKAAAVADVVILDLEDAVAPSDKEAARRSLIDTPLDPARTVVRVNQSGTADHEKDKQALDATSYRRIMLSKTESEKDVLDLMPREVVALIESPRGALRTECIAAAANTIGLMWGAEDLVAAIGGSSSRCADGSYRDVARQVRTSTLLAAKANERFVLDSVYLDIPDLPGLVDETLDAVAVGFDGKVAIHPTQVDKIRQTYAPSETEQDWARRVLAAVAGERGVFAFEGKMVDAPVLRHAERIVRRGEAARQR